MFVSVCCTTRISPLSPYSWASLPLPHSIPLGHHRAPSWAPCALQRLPFINICPSNCETQLIFVGVTLLIQVLPISLKASKGEWVTLHSKNKGSNKTDPWPQDGNWDKQLDNYFYSTSLNKNQQICQYWRLLLLAYQLLCILKSHYKLNVPILWPSLI